MKIYNQPELQQLHASFFTAGRSPPLTVLPPKTTQETFNLVLECFTKYVGKENVVTGDDLVNFVDPFAINQNHIPSAAVW